MQEKQGIEGREAAPQSSQVVVNARETVASSSGQRVGKRAFGEIIGVSPGRVTQLIAAGLPVENGKIDIARGRDWYRENVDGRGAPAPKDLFAAAGSAREDRDFHEARIRKIRADKLAGDVVDRREVERTIFARARFERDAWLSWIGPTAATIARAIGVDEAALAAALDARVRAHLTELAERPAC